MKIKTIYWFSHYNLNSPSVRYRGKYALDHLKENSEINCYFIYPEPSLKKILLFLKMIFLALFFKKSSSLVVIQKVYTNNLYANTLKLLILLRKRNTLYDWDDAEYVRQNTKTLHFFLSKCSTITVGSNALKKYSKQFNPHVIYNTTPVIEHSIIKKSRNKILHIGWVGDVGINSNESQDFSHYNNLFNIFFPEIKKIKFPCKLSIIGVKNQANIPQIKNYFKDAPNIEIIIPENLDWKNDQWIYAKIAEFDIGVSPLNSHPFNVAKSAFKAKQYLSVGVPTIASDIGENSNFIKNNFNGFLCNSNGDFLHTINKISEMTTPEYSNLINNAISGKKEYSMEKYISQILKLCE